MTNIRIDVSETKEVADAIKVFQRKYKQSVRRALKFGLRRGQKYVVDGVATKLALTKRNIRAQTSTEIRTIGGEFDATVFTTGKSTPLAKFKNSAFNWKETETFVGGFSGKKKKFITRSGTGRSFKVWKGQRRERYKHVFLSRAGRAVEHDLRRPNPNRTGFWPKFKKGPGAATVVFKTPGLIEGARQKTTADTLAEMRRLIDLDMKGIKF
ncbi:MAG: hypothetical protein ACPGF7_09565 [Pontibacterium sp.]